MSRSDSILLNQKLIVANITSTDCVHGDVPAPVPADQNTAARERLGEPGGPQ